MNQTLIINGVGYEGIEKLLIVKGKDVKECLIKAYLELDGYDDIDDLAELDEYELISKLESDFDSADWVLCGIYDLNREKILYDDNCNIIEVEDLN